MRIAIAGGSGFVGRALAPELIAAGHDVVALSRHGGEVPGGEARAVDVGDEAELRAALDGLRRRLLPRALARRRRLP